MPAASWQNAPFTRYPYGSFIYKQIKWCSKHKLHSNHQIQIQRSGLRLNRVRKGKDERLTENTLIRVAIDLLLENTNQLQGITEDELLESLGLPPSDSR